MFIVAWSMEYSDEKYWELIDGRDATDIFVDELVKNGIPEFAIHVGEEEEDSLDIPE